MARTVRSKRRAFIASLIERIGAAGKNAPAFAETLLADLPDAELGGMRLEASGALMR